MARMSGSDVRTRTAGRARRRARRVDDDVVFFDVLAVRFAINTPARGQHGTNRRQEPRSGPERRPSTATSALIAPSD
jgi:hypothetical protein